MVVVLVLGSIDPPKILFIVFLGYGLSGPVLYVLRQRQRARRRGLGLSDAPEKHEPCDSDKVP